MGNRSIKGALLRMGICLAVFSLLSGFEGLAAEPEPQKEELSGVEVEYGELGNLIHAGNPGVQDIARGLEHTREDYGEILESLRLEREDVRSRKEEAEDEGDMEGYVNHASLEAIYQSGIRSYNQAMRRMDQYSANRERILLEKQLTSAAQSLMISWQSLVAQQEYLGNMDGLCLAQYEDALRQMQAGLATGDAVDAAYRRWTEVRASLTSLEDSRRIIYQKLCLLLGLESGGSVSLQKIPPADPGRVGMLNLEEDTRRAINNNTAVVNARHTSAKDTPAIKNKRIKTAELEEKVKIQMAQLYEETLQAKLSYEAAAAGLAGAEISWADSQARYSMGMLGRTEFLQKETEYINKRTAFVSADLNLFQALQRYEWAVDGIIEETQE